MTHYIITRRFDDQAEVYTADRRGALLEALTAYALQDDEAAADFETAHAAALDSMTEAEQNAAFNAYCQDLARTAMTTARRCGAASLFDLDLITTDDGSDGARTTYYRDADGMRHAIRHTPPERWMILFNLDDNDSPRGWTGARDHADALRILASLAPGITPG